MNCEALNITNGDAFNQYFLKNFGGTAVPFREVMMDGDTVHDIFSDAFVKLRSAELNVSTDEYRANMLVCDALKNDYTELVLWFGKDTFCQMNLLTLLAYLEQTNYHGKVTLNYIDDETFEVLDSNINIELDTYKKLYEEILISKHIPNNTGVLDKTAIELYFDYHSADGKLVQMVRENADREHMELLCLLLCNSKEYGLSDAQAQELVKKYKVVD